MQKIVRELSDAVGIGNAIEICRKWGGRDFNVPAKVSQNDPLALAVGLDCAQRMVAAFGGDKLQLPAERNALIDLRNEAIVKAVKPIDQGGDGKSHEQAGLEFGVTRQRVSQILSERERITLAGDNGHQKP